ncbi:MAG: hypothetical protein EAZ92_16030 [Candidatus Kapaibacterium sp.]|nr:MAG: hypothetical protein EAZ92_16030 [Candidatus Kapabacteria bacterium]
MPKFPNKVLRPFQGLQENANVHSRTISVRKWTFFKSNFIGKYLYFSSYTINQNVPIPSSPNGY